MLSRIVLSAKRLPVRVGRPVAVASFSSFPLTQPYRGQYSNKGASEDVNWSLLVFSALASMGLMLANSECERQHPVTSPTPSNLPNLLHELSKFLHADQIELDEGERRVRGKPWNSYHTVDAYPHFILYPTSTEQVSQIVRLCNAHQMPIVAFGGGTSLEGQTLTLKGGVSLDFGHMKEVGFVLLLLLLIRMYLVRFARYCESKSVLCTVLT